MRWYGVTAISTPGKIRCRRSSPPPRSGGGGHPRQSARLLITVSSRRLTDLLPSDQARQRREDAVARWTLPGQWGAPAADCPASESDDTLILLFMCCHPSLSPASQIALTLRPVGGLATAEIARAFLVPEATTARRLLAPVDH